MLAGTQEKKRKLSQGCARSRHDGTTGEYAAIEDGSDNPELETTCRRPSGDVATEMPFPCGGPQTSALGFRSSQISQRYGRQTRARLRASRYSSLFLDATERRFVGYENFDFHLESPSLRESKSCSRPGVAMIRPAPSRRPLPN
jgi:hypothetical protein